MSAGEVDRLRELIRECDVGNRACDKTVWGIIEPIAHRSLIRFWSPAHMEPGLVDDFVQYLFVHIHHNGDCLLRQFHGRSLAEFEAFVRKLVRRFMLRHLQEWRRQVLPGAHASLENTGEPVSGTSEAELLEALAELEENLTETERQHLDGFLGRSSGPRGVRPIGCLLLVVLHQENVDAAPAGGGCNNWDRRMQQVQ